MRGSTLAEEKGSEQCENCGGPINPFPESGPIVTKEIVTTQQGFGSGRLFNH